MDVDLWSAETTTETIPDAPTALDASDITDSSFTANWYFNENTTGYYLDVATDSAFTSIVAGYNNLDVGNVNNYSVIGLDDTILYYYRVRAYNSSGTSTSSNTIMATTMVPAASSVLAGTGNNGLILRSDNGGITFVSEGSKGYGNITGMTKMYYSDDIVYVTDGGDIYNYTTDVWYANIGEAATCIFAYYQNIGEDVLLIGTATGKVYVYDVVYDTLSLLRSVPATATIYGIHMRGSAAGIFTSEGIFCNSDITPDQAGDFRCKCEMSVGVYYAADASGHVWKSSGYDFVHWTDLGQIDPIYGLPFYAMAINGSRIIVVGNNCSYYSEDDFVTSIVASLDDNTSCNYISLVVVSSTILLSGNNNGGILRSVDNGDIWLRLSSNPQSGEAIIKALVKLP